MKSRLSNFTETDNTTFTYWSIGDGGIILNLPMGEANEKVTITMARLADAEDWEVVEGHTLGASLASATECTSIQIIDRFVKENKAVPDKETIEWSIPMERWPDSMKRAASSSDAAMPATRSGGEPKRPKAGDGRARVSQ